MPDIKAVKFGGSSLCDAKAIERAARIVQSDERRRYITVSAPGKRFGSDEKITDMLYSCFRATYDEFMFLLEKIKSRFDAIISDLQIPISLDADFGELIYGRRNYFGRDYFVSRGEFFCAKIVSAYLGFDFVDASRCIRFDERGAFLPADTAEKTAKELSFSEHAVIPGFYGSMPGGTIKTFARGGSDITGAIVAAAVGADVYENWTDVSGFMSADPKTVDDPKKIDVITYDELRRLSFMGANVLHEDAVLPLREANIPVIIKNTLSPEEKGTKVVYKRTEEGANVCGIAGRGGFSIMLVGKDRIGSETDERRKILEILARKNVATAGIYSGIDCVAFAVEREGFSERADYIRNEISQYAEARYVTLISGCALISIVGASPCGMLSKIFTAVSETGAKILCIDAGAGEEGVTIGVKEEKLKDVIRALYKKLIDENKQLIQ